MSLPEYINNFEKNIIEFGNKCNEPKNWNSEGLKLLRNNLISLNKKFSKLRIKVRSQYVNYTEEDRKIFEDDLLKYDTKINKLKEKYLLLLI